MRRVQRIAVQRFAERGFATVTVDEIAQEADVAPITIYRHFGTKERLVLWDEFDPPILDEIARRLPAQEPLDAVRAALGTLLDTLYAKEAPLALARASLATREPALLASAAVDAKGFAASIAALIEAAGTPAFDARVLADVAVAALASAVTEWERRQAETPLASLIDEAFATVGVGGKR